MKRGVLLAVLVVLAGCGGGSDPKPEEAAKALTDIKQADDFAAAFNGDQGVPRLILIVSPT